MRKKRDTKTDKVVRIDASLYERIKQLNPEDGKKRTLNELLQLILDSVEPLINGEMKYATVLFADPADARGDAIMRAVRAKEAPTMPKIVVVLGEDEL